VLSGARTSTIQLAPTSRHPTGRIMGGVVGGRCRRRRAACIPACLRPGDDGGPASSMFVNTHERAPCSNQRPERVSNLGDRTRVELVPRGKQWWLHLIGSSCMTLGQWCATSSTPAATRRLPRITDGLNGTTVSAVSRFPFTPSMVDGVEGRLSST
jgi:hypothetical protein